MTSSVSRTYWQLAAVGVLVGCTPTPPAMDDGHTTTTYSGSNGDSADGEATSDDGNPGDVDDGEPGDPSDGEPGDPTDDDDSDSGTSSGPLDIGNPDGAPNGSVCTSDEECSSLNCYVIPFLGGQCGQCNEDADCNDGGCTPHNPFTAFGSFCNLGEAGAGCESDAVCAGDLQCSTAFDLLDLIQLNTCGSCLSDMDCDGPELCAPIVDLAQWTGQNTCIDPNSLPQHAYCNLEGNGNEACASGICSAVDVQGLAEIGVCGQCNNDLDCDGGVCTPGEFLLDNATLLGSTCR